MQSTIEALCGPWGRTSQEEVSIPLPALPFHTGIKAGYVGYLPSVRVYLDKPAFSHFGIIYKGDTNA